MKSWLAQGSSGRRVTLLPGTTFLHINGAEPSLPFCPKTSRFWRIFPASWFRLISPVFFFNFFKPKKDMFSLFNQSF